MPVERKACTKCLATKPADAFFPDKRRASGLRSACKDCDNARARVLWRAKYHGDHEYRARRLLYIRDYQRKRETWRTKDKAKANARFALNRAVKSGRITKPSECSRCGVTGNIQGHHHDYSKRLDVEWLCSKCHAEEHRKEQRQ
jgi:ribosomal protein S27AE